MSSVAVLAQLTISGLALGSVYGLVALGFVLIYRTTNVVNFAQGDFAMLGAYIMVVTLSIVRSGSYLMAVLAVLVVMALFGVFFAVTVYRPLQNRSFLPVIVSTIGASLVIENGSLAIFGPVPRQVRPIFGAGGFHIGGVFISSQYAVIIAITAVLVVLQQMLYEKTAFGRRLQAVQQDKNMAKLLGIRVTRLIIFTFAFSAAIGGLAGLLVAPILSVTVGLGTNVTLQAFAASIIGGFGSVLGAIIGGVIVGLSYSFGSYYVSSAYASAFSFALLILVLLVKPNGILGEKVGEKA